MAEPPTVATPGANASFLEFTNSLLSQFGIDILSSIPEVRSVAFIVDWNVPLAPSVTPGVAMTRDREGNIGELRSPLATFGLLQQCNRMGLMLSNLFQEMLVLADEKARSLAKEIHDKQSYLDGINSRIKEAEDKVGADLAGPADAPANGPAAGRGGGAPDPDAGGSVDDLSAGHP